MKKLLGILVLGLLLCTPGIAFEDLSNTDINKLRKLKSYEIKTALNNKKIVGYYDVRGDGTLDYFEEIHTSQGDYFGYSEYEGEVIGKWKVNNDELCYKWKETSKSEEQTEFLCIVYVYTNNKNAYYFYDINNKVFYAKGYRVR